MKSTNSCRATSSFTHVNGGIGDDLQAALLQEVVDSDELSSEPADFDMSHFIHDEEDMKPLRSDRQRATTSPTELFGMPEESEETPYSYDQIIREAKVYYGDAKPMFCIARPSQMSKHVQHVDDGRELTLHYQKWFGEAFGYWEWDDDGTKYVVKHDKGQYHIWLGLNERLQDDPIAVPVTRQGKQGTNARVTPEDALPVDRYDLPMRSFRKRSMRQQNPFKLDKVQYSMQRQGKVANESDVEWEAHYGSKRKQAPKASRKETGKKRKSTVDSPRLLLPADSVPSPAASGTESPIPASTCRFSSTEALVSEDRLFQHTTLRSRHKSIPDSTIALYLRDEGIDNLFGRIVQKWKLFLGDQNVSHLRATFPWLPAGSSIILQRGDADGLSKLLEEVRLAPS